ncbi:MAG: hypothetical protein HYZ08_00335 [Candidatus Kerfeldbacteria bacterium]|nr:hypothetical protein [Candidatus Kerfeldbacteria bacterium]
MRQSQLFGKTQKTASKDSSSMNHALLVRGGFMHQEMAGVFTYLPLGLRVLRKIERIVREEMNTLGAQEILMPVLHPKAPWVKTGRWDSVDVLFKVSSSTGGEYALGATHEEIVTPLVKLFVQSYHDLPVALYQIQTKFRDELRPKSGILRGREFGMKDLYSFHASVNDFEQFYAKVCLAYQNIFRRLELPVHVIEASGGAFTKKLSHEFSVLTPSGEDTIVYCKQCSFARNIEVAKERKGSVCPSCGTKLFEDKAIEAANIFDLGTRFSDPFDLTYTDNEGKRHPIVMGCYGLGTSRILGTIVEVRHDERGIQWPKSVAPFDVHLIELGINEETHKRAAHVYHQLKHIGLEVLWDDRNARGGEKLHDSDLIGIPIRVIISDKNEDQLEWKERASEETLLLTEVEAMARVQETISHL